MTGTIDAIGEIRDYTFSATAGEVVNLEAQAACAANPLEWRLMGPDGEAWGSRESCNDLGRQVLATAGTTRSGSPRRVRQPGRTRSPCGRVSDVNARLILGLPTSPGSSGVDRDEAAVPGWSDMSLGNDRPRRRGQALSSSPNQADTPGRSGS